MSTDHITLPQTSLKQFASSGRIYYFDLSDNQIHHSTVKSFNTGENYYSVDVENYLSREIETIIGRIRTKIEKVDMSKPSIIFSKEMRDEIIRCFAIQQARVPAFAEMVRDKTDIAKYYDLPQKFYSPLHKDKSYIETLINIAFERLNEYDINICFVNDNSTLSFVLPSTHVLFFKGIIFFVLSPKRAIAILHNSLKKQFFTEMGSLRYIDCSNNDQLKEIFSQTIKSEDQFGTGKIVGCMDDLKMIESIRNK